ncbi:hypothetical protein Tco_0270385 [Tanacetum coccineum]
MTQTVPSKSTANVTYQGTARSRVPQAVLSRSTDGPYYPRMDNRRPRISKGNKEEEDLKDYDIIDSGFALEDEESQERGQSRHHAFRLLRQVSYVIKECLILSPKFKFVDEDLVILRAPRKNDVLQTGACNPRTLTSWFKASMVRGFTFQDIQDLSFVILDVNKGKTLRLLANRLKKELSENLYKFSWVFFLAYKDETYDMLHDLIVGLENRLQGT